MRNLRWLLEEIKRTADQSGRRLTTAMEGCDKIEELATEALQVLGAEAEQQRHEAQR